MKQIIIGLFIILLVACNQQPVQVTVKTDTPRDTVYNTTYKDGTDCMCDSIQSYYYDSGALMWEIPFINEKEHGVSKWYYENGKLAGTATYKNCKLAGYKKCSDGRVGNEKLDCLKSKSAWSE